MFDIPSPDGSPEEIGLTHATAYSPEGEIHLWRNGPGGEGGGNPIIIEVLFVIQYF